MKIVEDFKGPKVYIYIASSNQKDRARPIHVTGITPNKLRSIIVKAIKGVEK